MAVLVDYDESDNLSVVGTTTVTCTGCSEGCHPEQSGEFWNCTECESLGLGTCEKSESSI
tara:strand:- start:1501 stop:1680 length:180 start_codon:yes stop_codon:yes gene_type:complete